jgi:hypothetical protein
MAVMAVSLPLHLVLALFLMAIILPLLLILLLFLIAAITILLLLLVLALFLMATILLLLLLLILFLVTTRLDSRLRANPKKDNEDACSDDGQSCATGFQPPNDPLHTVLLWISRRGAGWE